MSKPDKNLTDFAALQTAASEGDTEALLAALDHPALLLRHVAHQELMAMSSGAGAAAGFDPFAAAESRTKAVAAWRDLAAKGALDGVGRVQLQRGQGAERPASEPLTAGASAKRAVRVLDGLIAASARVEAVDALVVLLDADPKAARYALACLKRHTASARLDTSTSDGSGSGVEGAKGDDDQVDAEAFRSWWQTEGRARYSRQAGQR